MNDRIHQFLARHLALEFIDPAMELELDSIDRIDLILGIEDEFEIEIDDDDIETPRTVGDIVRLIDEHL